MAQAVHTVITDDLDDTALDPADATTVRWAWRGVTYEFDTHNDALARIESDEQSVSIGMLLAVSRKVDTRARRAAIERRAVVAPSAIREWARLNGHNVPDRGRIPAPIREAYLSAT